MATEVPARGAVSSIVDVTTERLGEIGLLAIFGLVKAYNKYTDRRARKRSGRRASDGERAACARAIKRLEAVAAELAIGLERLRSRVDALERDAATRDA
jgi:hypothetical protein